MTSTSANDRQVGGDHYRGRGYQHWDFVTDVKLPYLLGCATKYVSRWREKNGVQDLEKAMHYIDKAVERGVDHSAAMGEKERLLLQEFAEQHPNAECFVISAACIGDYDMAKHFLRGLIAVGQEESATESPTPASPA